MKERKWTPLHLKLILEYYTMPGEKSRAPAVDDFTMELKDFGLVDDGLACTEKGCAFVELLLRTKLPEQAWVSDGEILVVGGRVA